MKYAWVFYEPLKTFFTIPIAIPSAIPFTITITTTITAATTLEPLNSLLKDPGPLGLPQKLAAAYERAKAPAQASPNSSACWGSYINHIYIYICM